MRIQRFPGALSPERAGLLISCSRVSNGCRVAVGKGIWVVGLQHGVRRVGFGNIHPTGFVRFCLRYFRQGSDRSQKAVRDAYGQGMEEANRQPAHSTERRAGCPGAAGRVSGQSHGLRLGVLATLAASPMPAGVCADAARVAGCSPSGRNPKAGPDGGVRQGALRISWVRRHGQLVSQPKADHGLHDAGNTKAQPEGVCHAGVGSHY
jgi:hypothetical protein